VGIVYIPASGAVEIRAALQELPFFTEILEKLNGDY